MSDRLPDPATIQAIAREVASLLREPSGLMTAREVAMQLGVAPEWVYAHAEELGVLRLGDGPRPRLRFDPAVVQQRLLPRPPARPVGDQPPSTHGHAALLPINSTRPRRSLDQE